MKYVTERVADLEYQLQLVYMMICENIINQTEACTLITQIQNELIVAKRA